MSMKNSAFVASVYVNANMTVLPLALLLEIFLKFYSTWR